VDLGSSSYEFKDLYIDGVAYTDALGFGTVAMTLPTADGSANQVLKTDGSGALSWVTQSSTVVTITDNESTDEGNALVFAADADLDGGTLGLESDGDATYNPSTGTIAATNFSGNLTGTLQTAAQGNVTSLGTLTTLTVDNVITDGTTIGHTDDTDLMTLADGSVTFTGSTVIGTADVNGGAIDGATIGANSASTGAFTTITASTSLDVTGSTGVILENDETITNSTDGTVLINGTVSGGTGSAAGVFQSNGDNDVTLKTGNSNTGSITITDGANEDIAVAPNGTGETTFGGNPISNYSASTVSITSATTLATSHNGKVLICNSSSDFSLTIPEDTLPAGFNVMIVQKGAGEITLAAASGNVTINNRNSHTKTANTWAIMSLICIDATTDANVFVSGGDGAS